MPATFTGGWLVLVGVLSLAAALLHAAAAAEHRSDAVLAGAFAVIAAFQAGWTLAVVLRPERTVLWAGLVANTLALGAYVASRTVGLGGLAGVEPIGRPDLTCALAEAMIVASTAYLLAPRHFLPSYRRLRLAPVAVGVGLVTVFTVPALTAPHGEGSHEHEAGGTHAHTTTADIGSTRATTADERALVAATGRSLTRWRDVRRAEADGYQSADDLGWQGFEHYINWALVDTPRTLDASQPESLVYAVDDDGTRRLVSAMYLMPWGTTVEQQPAIGVGGWHTHETLCFDDQMRVVGWTIGDTDRCYPRGEVRRMAPMLHVWVVPNRCGPFAQLEDSLDLGGSTRVKLLPARTGTGSNPSPCGHGHSDAGHGTGPAAAL